MARWHRLTLLLVVALAESGCVSYSGVEHPVSFRSSDGTRLEGSFLLPHGAETSVPAVVILHGAEPATRSIGYRTHANIFLEQGLAVLLYDKRGAGESEGDHSAATYAQLVEDAIAAVHALRSRPEVDSTRIGLVGISESGWLTPEIAERVGGIRFVINKVGPCSSWADTNAWEVYNELIAEGWSPEEATEQVAVFRRLWRHYAAPDPAEREGLKASLKEWSNREGSPLPDSIRSVSASFAEDISYDPTPFLQRAAYSLLYVYGSEDVNIPTAECVQRLTGMQAAGVPVSYHVFDGEGHELGGPSITGYRLTTGYSEVLIDFVERQIR